MQNGTPTRDRRSNNAQEVSHICVCICTFQRPTFLERLLLTLQKQKTTEAFTYSILVVDDDEGMSAKDLVLGLSRASRVRLDYRVAAKRNVAIARNVAVQAATGDLIAFIDDDETPVDTWLQSLFTAYKNYHVDGVLGPVRPVFDTPPPAWITKAKLFERPSHATGQLLHWNLTRTGNVLLRRSIFDDPDNLFDPRFRHGEDKDFFRRVTGKGLTFVWCEEAPVFEKQTPSRYTRTYFMKRALVRGSVSMRHYGYSKSYFMKSLLAVFLYTSSLPLLLLIGHHLFMRYVIKLCDHIGKLSAAFKVDLVDYFEGV